MHNKKWIVALTVFLLLIVFGNFATASTTVTDTSITTTGNLTLGEKITFTLGEIIDNIVDGWITITGNLNVTGNATISGISLKVNSQEVCLADGTNCQSSSSTIWNITSSQYLYNNSNILELNETILNATIDARDSDTIYSHLSNFTDDIMWTTTFNSTGDSRWTGGTDTQKNATGYLYNDSTTIYLNGTLLNTTIDARDSGTTYSHLSNFTDDLGDREYTNNLNFTNGAGYYNSTDFLISNYYPNSNPFGFYNSTTIGNLPNTNSYWNDTYATFNKTYADTLYAGIGVTGDNSSWNQTFADTLYADTSVVDTDTQKDTSGSYLYNDSTTIYFNDTVLNATIDDRAGGDNSSWNESYADTLYTPNTTTGIQSLLDNQNITLGEKITFTLGEIIDNIVDGWIQVTGSLNVTGNITVIGTSLKVNNQEVCLADGTNCQSSSGSMWNITSSQYLYNNSDILELNETRLNATIDARDSDTTYSHLSNFTDDINTSSSSFTEDLYANKNLVVSKNASHGIKVDTASPTFGWRDILGEIRTRGVGTTDPNDATYNGGIKAYSFDVNDEFWINYHIPHDYVNGTDLHLHFHWSTNSNTVTGGSVNWSNEITYAKGHNQSTFISPITATITCPASTTQYQHMICEAQLSSLSPSANQLDTSQLEPDGIIIIRGYLSSNDITSSSSVPDPFLHYQDIHYQSINIGTKQKSPDFYT